MRQHIEAFYFAYREFTRVADDILEKRGLNRVHHRIVYFIGRNPGISVGGLLHILKVSKQALNAPLRQLTEMGYVDRATGKGDRRVRNLMLTEKGLALEESLTRAQLSLLDDTFQQYQKPEIGTWLDIMQRLGDRSGAAGRGDQS